MARLTRRSSVELHTRPTASRSWSSQRFSATIRAKSCIIWSPYYLLVKPTCLYTFQQISLVAALFPLVFELPHQAAAIQPDKFHRAGRVRGKPDMGYEAALRRSGPP